MQNYDNETKYLTLSDNNKFTSETIHKRKWVNTGLHKNIATLRTKADLKIDQDKTLST